MQETSNFEPLFLNEEGEPYRFYIWHCAERKRLKELIEVRFGEVTEDPNGDYTIQLADPKTRTSGEVYSIYYITECCSLGKLLDLREYRINPTSKYSAAFCPMDVLQGHIKWKDAEVFSLDNESSVNSTPSSKRRKVSGATSTDEEVEVVEQMEERQRYQSTSQGTLSRTVKRRSPYKLKEKEAMVQYLKAHKAYKAIKGTAIWKRMEEDKVCPNRTWQSMKEHFLKHILPHVESFDFSSSEVACLKKTMSRTRRKQGVDGSAASQDGDDDDGDDIVSFAVKRYTPEEDEAILKFISCDRRYLRAGGVRIWQRMERRQIVPGRSWQSLKERYRKNLVHRLNTYVNQDELTRMETWCKGSSRSVKTCTCCAMSKSPASTIASGDTSITSSSEFNTSDHVHHKRKLFTQHKSPVQFTPASESRPRQRVPGISTIARNTASCVSHIQTLAGNTTTTTTGSTDCKGDLARKFTSREDVIAAKKKVLQTVKTMENKGKTNLQMRNDKQNVNHSSSSSASGTSIVSNCGTPGPKEINSEALRARERQRCLEIQNSKQQVNHSSSSTASETSIVSNCGTPGSKEISSEALRASERQRRLEMQNGKQQVNHSSSSSALETSIVSNCGTPGPKEISSEDLPASERQRRLEMQNGKQQVNHSSSSSASETSIVSNCGTPGRKEISFETLHASERQRHLETQNDKQQVNHSSSSPASETSIVSNCGTPDPKEISFETLHASERQRHLEIQNGKQQVNHSSSSSASETSIVANCGTPGPKEISSEALRASERQRRLELQNGKEEVKDSPSSSASESSIVANCGTPGHKEISSETLRASERQRRLELQNGKEEVKDSPSSSASETSIVANCGTPGHKEISSETLRASERQRRLEMQNGKQEVNHSSSLSASEMFAVPNCGIPGQKNIDTVSEAAFANEAQRYVSSTSSDAGLGTSLTDVNKECVPERDENENSSEHYGIVSTSQETIIIEPDIFLLTTAHTDHEYHSGESDQLQEMVDAPTHDKQSHTSYEAKSTEITANLSSSSIGVEGSDMDYSPEKKEPVSPSSNDILDKPPNGVGSEHSSAKTQDATCLEPLSHSYTARVSGVNTSTSGSSKHHKRKLFMNYDFPVVLTPVSENEHRPSVPEIASLAKSIQFLHEENLAQNTDSRYKTSKPNKKSKHKGSPVVSKVDKTARMPKKCRKLKKFNVAQMENDKETDHLNDNVAEKSHETPFSSTSLESWISQYKSKKKGTLKGRKRIANDKTYSGQPMETDETQALPSCSKNSESTSLKEEEVTLINTARNTKKDKMKSYYMDDTEATHSGGLHIEINESHTHTSCLKSMSYSAESNQVASTSRQYQDATPSSNQNITSKPNPESSFKNEKSSQRSITDDGGKSRDVSRRLQSNENMSNVTTCNSELHKDDITILDLEEIIPQEGIKTSQEILSEHSETQTDPNEIIHALLSSDSDSTPGNRDLKVFRGFQENDNGIIFYSRILEHIKQLTHNGKYTELDEGFPVTSFKKMSSSDRSCSVGQSPTSEKIKAIQVCEISNSNAGMLLSQETNSSFNPKSNSSDCLRSPTNNQQHCLHAGSLSTIFRNTDLLPNENAEKLESVLCNESDNEANTSQETSQHLGTAVRETPDVTDDDSDQLLYNTPSSDQQLVSVNHVSCGNQDKGIFSCDSAAVSSSGLMSESSQVYRMNSSPKDDGFGQGKVFGHIESVQSLASEIHPTGNEEIDKASCAKEGQTSGKPSPKHSPSPSRSDEAYLSFLNHLNTMEVENFNLIKAVDEAVNTWLSSTNYPNTLLGSKPGDSLNVKETKSNDLCLEGQDSLNVVLNMKEEPECSSDEMETLRTFVNDHDYCVRRNGIEIKEKCEDALCDEIKIEEDSVCEDEEYLM